MCPGFNFIISQSMVKIEKFAKMPKFRHFRDW